MNDKVDNVICNAALCGINNDLFTTILEEAIIITSFP